MNASGREPRAATPQLQAGQLQLAQPLQHPFSGLGLERCQHQSQRGHQCATLGSWDGLSGLVLCDAHADEAA